MIEFTSMMNKCGRPIPFLGIVFLAALLLAAPSAHASKKEAKPAAEGGEGGGKEGGGFVLLEPIIVNLASEGGRRFLKISIQLEPGGADTAQEITNHQAQVIDALITLLSSQTAAGLLTVEGKSRLKEQILAKLNEILKSGVKNVFFVEFIMQ